MDARQLLDEQLPKLLSEQAAQAQQVDAVFVLELTGERGGTWTLDLKSRPPSVKRGAAEGADTSVKLAVEDFEAIVAEPSRAIEMFFGGKLQVSGNPALATRLPALISLMQVR
jgi:hypothetical protein